MRLDLNPSSFCAKAKSKAPPSREGREKDGAPGMVVVIQSGWACGGLRLRMTGGGLCDWA
jgi:hypothetical protein